MITVIISMDYQLYQLETKVLYINAYLPCTGLNIFHTAPANVVVRRCQAKTHNADRLSLVLLDTKPTQAKIECTAITLVKGSWVLVLNYHANPQPEGKYLYNLMTKLL